MTLLQSIILGIIQGLTEFLPISSSAHLVLVPDLLGWQIPEAQVFPFGVLVQLGTLAAVIIYFWSDLVKIIVSFVKGIIQRKPFEDSNARLGWYLILATIPAMIAGLLLKDKVEAVFNDAKATAYFLFGTAALLVIAETIGKRNRNLSQMKWFDAVWMGLFQALSIFPGISRSGSTIAGGMTRHLDRPSAARFSFIMSIPVMLGAGLISTLDVIKMPGIGSFLPVILVGIVAALLVGYLSIHWLLIFLHKRSFYWFAIYCVLLAGLVLIVGSVRQQAQAASLLPTPTIHETTTEVSPTTIMTTPEDHPFSAALTPALEWMVPAMSTCAGTIEQFSIITKILATDQLESSDAQIVFRLGEPESLTNYAAQLGFERMVLIVNPQNTLNALPYDIVQKIAQGKYETWGQVSTDCSQCFSTTPNEEISTHSPVLNFFAPDDEIQGSFENTVMSGLPVANAIAWAIPSGKQMVENVAGDPAAFGLATAHYLNDSVKEIAITDIDPSLFQIPILAITNEEPSAQAREWLLCLQQVLNP